eukprot:GHRR01001027.1.p1 GENE.GHRR01001027.1~~GHRR01001027.1.p1  ORF type:complete len:1006 (+),score=494.19 GHRR01001027.1:90-3107(+)
MVFLPGGSNIRLPNVPEGLGGGSGNMSARFAGRHRQPAAPSRVAHSGWCFQKASTQSRVHALAQKGLLEVDNAAVWDIGSLNGQAAVVPISGLSVVQHPAGCHQASFGSAASSKKHNSSNSRNSSSSSHPLPEELVQLADAAAPVVLPPPGSVPPGSLDNRELDKLVGTLGRNKATWRRALLLSQWLQDSGHILDDRLCTTLIRVCSEHGQAMTALSVYEWMKAPVDIGGAGLAPTVYTYTAAMRAALSAGLLDRALAVWEDAQAAKCQLDCRLCITYIEVCSRKGLADRALSMYAAMRAAPRGSKLAPTVHAYTAAMRAATEGGRWQKALEIWSDMTSAGVLPTGHAFAAAMSACAAGSNWQQAVALFEDMCRVGINPDVVSCTALITALAAAGQWQRSEAVVHWMLSVGVRPNVRTYTAMLTALGNARQWDRALEMLQLMQQPSWGGVMPNSYTYAALLKGLGECGEWQRAELLFCRLEQQALAAASATAAPAAQGGLAAANLPRTALAAANSGSSWPTVPAAADAVACKAAAAAVQQPSVSAAADRGLSSGLDAEVSPNVWGWQAPAGNNKGLIQRPSHLPGDSSRSHPIRDSSVLANSASNSNASSSGNGIVTAAGTSNQSLWISASQLHGLDLQLQHDAAGLIDPVSIASSAAGSVCSDSPAPAVSPEPCVAAVAANGNSSSSSSSPMQQQLLASSSNMLAQQLAQLAIQQQLEAIVDLQMLMLQQQQYHQPQAAAMQQQLSSQAVRRSITGSSRPGTAAVAAGVQLSNAAAAVPAAAVINASVVSSLMLAYHRAEKWQEAVGALGRAATLGVTPDAAMFNIAISAAGKAGQSAVAEALFTQATAAGVADAATYETMIGALGMAGDPARAEVMVRAMQSAGCKPGDYAYCSLIAAYSLAGDATSAMRVRSRMVREGKALSVHVYNALVAAADRAGMLDKALDLLRSMRRDGIEPNALTQQLAADVGRKGTAAVEGQQITAAALSAAMAAAGTLLIQRGMF